MFMSHSNITPPMNSLRFLSSEMNRPPCIPFFLLILWNTLFFSRFAIQFLTWLKIQLFRTSHSRTVRWSQINLLAYESSTFSHIFVRSFLNVITAPIIGTHVYLYCCWLWRWFLLHFGLLRLWYWTRYSPDPSAYRTAHVILKIYIYLVHQTTLLEKSCVRFRRVSHARNGSWIFSSGSRRTLMYIILVKNLLARQSKYIWIA